MAKYFYKSFQIARFGNIYVVIAPFLNGRPVFATRSLTYAKDWIESVKSMHEVRKAAANFKEECENVL